MSEQLNPPENAFDFIDPFETVTEGQISPDFAELRDSLHLIPAKLYITLLMQDFKDPDGNFLEQFQSNGFHQRLWELYLDTTFKRQGLNVDKTHDRPDFRLDNGVTDVFVEATVASASKDGMMDSCFFTILTQKILYQ